jgi:hypothetical protein
MVSSLFSALQYLYLMMYTIGAYPRLPALYASEVDEGAGGVGVEEFYRDLVAYVEAFAALDDAALKRGAEDADVDALLRRAGDDAGEGFADAVGHGDCGDALLHGALDLAEFGVGVVAVEGDGGEVGVGVGRGPWRGGRAG